MKFEDSQWSTIEGQEAIKVYVEYLEKFGLKKALDKCEELKNEELKKVFTCIAERLEIFK